MEQIQQHELQDIYRVKEGLILEINKFKKVKYLWNSDGIKKKKLKGISKTYIFEEDYIDTYSDELFEIGTILKDGCIINKVDPDDYTIELKSSGGSIYGSVDQHLELYEEISKLLAKYKKD